MPRWMINCQDYAKLVSDGMDQPLSAWDRMSLKIHQWICPPCKYVQDHFNAIRQACRREPREDQDIDAAHYVLPDDICERIKSALKHVSK